MVVGVNCFSEGEQSPLVSEKDGGFMKVDDKAEKLQIQNVKEWKAKRNNKKALLSLKKLKETANEGKNIMSASIECAHNGVTTGEWSNIMREVYGEYRAPTGIVSSHISHKKSNGSDLEEVQR